MTTHLYLMEPMMGIGADRFTGMTNRKTWQKTCLKLVQICLVTTPIDHTSLSGFNHTCRRKLTTKGGRE